VDQNELDLINRAIELKRSDIAYFQDLKYIMVDSVMCDEAITRIKFEIAYLEALKDGPVVMFLKDDAKGFPDLASALAYNEAESIAAGKPPLGSILAIGPESAKAIENLMKEDDLHGNA